VEGDWQQKWGNNLGLSLCTMPWSSIVCVVAYFRRTELLPGVVYRLIGVKIDIKDVNDFNLWTKELGYN